RVFPLTGEEVCQLPPFSHFLVQAARQIIDPLLLLRSLSLPSRRSVGPTHAAAPPHRLRYRASESSTASSLGRPRLATLPRVGFAPTTYRLQSGCSTAALPGQVGHS